MKARRYTKKTFGYLDVVGGVADVGLLSAKVLDTDGSTVVTLTSTASLLLPDLYVTEEWLPSDVGNYTVTWAYNGTVLRSDQLTVSLDPTGDAIYDRPADYTLVRAAGDTVYGRIVDASDQEILAQTAAPFVADLGGYRLDDITISNERDVYLVWLVDDGGLSPVAMQPISVFSPRGKMLAKFTFSMTGEFNPAAVVDASVVVSVRGAPDDVVLRLVTDSQGTCEDYLDPGDYTATLFKDGEVFSLNNFHFSVVDTRATAVDPETVDPTNTYNFTTRSLRVSDTTPANPLDMCRVYGDFFGMTGRPMAGLQVSFTPVGYPSSLPNGLLVWDRPIVAETDGSGHFEVDVVQGITVRMDIQPLGITRVIGVPSGDDALNPVDVRTLVSATPDQYTIAEAGLPAAPRRTL